MRRLMKFHAIKECQGTYTAREGDVVDANRKAIKLIELSVAVTLIENI